MFDKTGFTATGRAFDHHGESFCIGRSIEIDFVFLGLVVRLLIDQVFDMPDLDAVSLCLLGCDFGRLYG